jgi:hypothetical protein
MKIRTWILGVLLALLPFAGYRGHAQAHRRDPGTLYIDARNGPRLIDITTHGTLLASITLPKGTVLSAADEHRNPTHLGGGKFEFHGQFVLRALPLADVPPVPPEGLSAEEAMTNAPLVLSARGVDVTLENIQPQ